MSPLTAFIIVISTITFQFTLYTIKRLQEPLEPELFDKRKLNLPQNKEIKYWENAEITNGRLAMIGLIAFIFNYGLFGWIIPGFF